MFYKKWSTTDWCRVTSLKTKFKRDLETANLAKIKHFEKAPKRKALASKANHGSFSYINPSSISYL